MKRPIAGGALPALAVALLAACSSSASSASSASSPVQPSAQLTVPAIASPAAPGTACAPGVSAVSYSDGLDKAVRGGVTLGGLSDLAWDSRSQSWVSTVDRHGSDPARVWFWRDPQHAAIARDPLVLRGPDGIAYNGNAADDEGLAVLPDGDFVVSSETGPTVRVFGRDGRQKASLPVPSRFAVAPAGQATDNETLEGLTVMPSGTRIIGAMEEALSGDTDAARRRFLVYDRGRDGAWSLSAQFGYVAEPGRHISEIASYGHDSLLVMEASYAPGTGNDIALYAVPTTRAARDVAAVADLATVPASALLPKTLVADLAKCPTLGATAKQAEANPLMGYYEGMAVVAGEHGWTVHLITDDNFEPDQITRVLTLTADLPVAG